MKPIVTENPDVQHDYIPTALLPLYSLLVDTTASAASMSAYKNADPYAFTEDPAGGTSRPRRGDGRGAIRHPSAGRDGNDWPTLKCLQDYSRARCQQMPIWNMVPRGL